MGSGASAGGGGDPGQSRTFAAEPLATHYSVQPRVSRLACNAAYISPQNKIQGGTAYVFTLFTEITCAKELEGV